MEAFARPAWSVVAYFATNWRRSSRLAFGVFVDGGGARRNASAARCSAARAASIAYGPRGAARSPRECVRSATSERAAAQRECTVAAVRDVIAAALRPNRSLICAASGAFAAARECLRLLGCLVSYMPLATRSINSQSRSFMLRRSRSASFRCVWLS